MNRWRSTGIFVLAVCWALSMSSCAIFGNRGGDKCPLVHRDGLNSDMAKYRDICDGSDGKSEAFCITGIHDLSSEQFKGGGRDGTYIFFPEELSCDRASFYTLAEVKGEASLCVVKFIRFRKKEPVKEVKRDLFGNTVETIKYVWRWYYSRTKVGCGVHPAESGGVSEDSEQHSTLVDIVERREAERLKDFEKLRTGNSRTILKKLFPFPLSNGPDDSGVAWDISEAEAWLESNAYSRVNDFEKVAYGDVLVEKGKQSRLALYLGRGIVATFKNGLPVFERVAESYKGVYRLVPAYALLGYQPPWETVSRGMQPSWETIDQATDKSAQ